MTEVENIGGRAGRLNQKEKNFTNFLLKEIVRGINTEEKLNNQFKESTSAFKKEDHY
jgi:helicase